MAGRYREGKIKMASQKVSRKMLLEIQVRQCKDEDCADDRIGFHMVMSVQVKVHVSK